MKGYTRAATIPNQSTSWTVHIFAQVVIPFVISHFSSNESQRPHMLLIIYINVGLENRPKDLGRFYFWMTVRGKDLNFLVASLSEAESAAEGSKSPILAEGNVPLSAYAKRKRLIEESATKQKLSDKRDQMYLFKEILSSSDSSVKTNSSSDCVEQSVIQKNLSTADKILSAVLKRPDINTENRRSFGSPRLCRRIIRNVYGHEVSYRSNHNDWRRKHLCEKR